MTSAHENQTSESEEEYSTPKKKQKVTKRECKFRDEYLSNDNFKKWLLKVPTNLTKAKCRYCGLIFSIKYEGIANLNKHAASSKHIYNEKQAHTTQTISSFYTQPNSNQELVVLATELSFIYHGVMHHHSFLSQECGIKLSSKLFSDSSLSQKLHCGRTKITAIIENVLLPFSVEILIKELTNGKPYSLATDASNKGNIKCWPLVITYFSKTEGVKEGLLNFYDDAKETSVEVTNIIETKLTSNDLKIKNMVSYSADNASVNYGRHNSIYQKLCNKNIIKANCNCHVLHNMAKHGRKNFKYDVETLGIKVFNEFSSSGKNLEELKGVFVFLEQDYSALLRHIPIDF